MKRLLIFLIVLINMQIAHADGIAKIRIKIAGTTNNHLYFLCLPGIGCLSIKAGLAGKIFPVLHSFEMDNMYIIDASRRTKPAFLGLPSSCQATVKPEQTLTISGHLSTNGANVKVNQLHCSVS